MNAFPATYFDGAVAQPHAVTMRLAPDTGEWIVTGANFERRTPLAGVQLVAPVGQSARFFRFADGASCESDAHADIAAAVATMNGVESRSVARRLESHAKPLAGLTLILVAALTFAFFWSLPRLANYAAALMPRSLETNLSRGTLAVLDQHVFLASQLGGRRQRELRGKIEALIQRIEFRREARVTFRRMRNGTANAFALPDGTIILTDALCDLAANDAEILAVVAHELGHLHHRHALRQLLEKSVTLLLVTSVTGDASILGNFGAALPLAIFSAKYSRDHEREADRFALTAMQQAEIPPQAFLFIMRKIAERNRDIYGKDAPAWLSTHPPTGERLKAFEPAPTTP